MFMEASISHFPWEHDRQKEPMQDPTEQLMVVLETLKEANESQQRSIERADGIIARLKQNLDDANAQMQSCVLGMNHWIAEYNRADKEKREWIRATVLAAIVALLAVLHLGLPAKKQTIDAVKGGAQSQPAQQ